jgi:hypothetical protein
VAGTVAAKVRLLIETVKLFKTKKLFGFRKTRVLALSAI